MVEPRASLRALVAAVGASLTVLGVLWGCAPPATAAAPAHPTIRAARQVAADATPLTVSIDTLTPSSLPARGKVEVTGTLTNSSEETWTTIRLYGVFDNTLDPMRTTADLAAAADTSADEYIGSRIIDVGTPGKVESLEPGDSATFSLSVPVSALDVDKAGVYWFGVHAIGESASSPRYDDSELAEADGKARTFLPYVPQRFDDDPLPTAVVVPIARKIVFASDGSLADVDMWQRSLETGGRLQAVPALVAAAGSTPVTYLADPSVLDAVARLARGNPARSLGPTGTTQPESAPPSASPSPGDADGSGDGSDNAGQGSTAAEPDVDLADLPADLAPVARAASDWLDDFEGGLSGTQVLTLPYGDLDLSAAALADQDDASNPGSALYDLAVAQRDTVLRTLDVESSPAIASPNGYLDAGAIGLTDPDTTVLLTDGAFRGRAPGVAAIAGRRAAVTSSGFADGGPGPAPGFTGLALRQRLLAEAAVRLLDRSPDPLVVTVPPQWDLADADTFFSGLTVSWLDLGTVENVLDSTTSSDVDPEDLVYPLSQQRRQVEPATIEAAGSLISSGDTLQNLLTDNNDVGGVLTEQALTAVSYALRDSQLGARATTNASRRWVAEKLGSVQISAPEGVTLSSASGSFAATLSNQLDQSVTVSVTGRSDDGGLVLTPPDPIVLAPGSRTTVVLKAKASSNRVHNVTLLVTDADGTPVGPSDALPIRSAQVSAVIWLIMATGAGLLFLAIIIRLVRRIRNARRGPLDVPGDEPDHERAAAPSPAT